MGADEKDLTRFAARPARRGLAVATVAVATAAVAVAALVLPRLFDDGHRVRPVAQVDEVARHGDGRLPGWWDESPTDDPSAGAPDELHVACTADGPQVDTDTVAAQSAGVVVKVDSTLPKGSYLTYTSQDGPAGGDPARGTTTYAFPPGQLTLGCAIPPSMDPIGSATVTVTDPYGYWREETLADHGCRASSAQPSWAVSATGSTGLEALEHLVEKLGAGYTADPAPIGYSGAATQTWVALRRGTPAFSIDVAPAATGFTAVPDVLCGG